MLSYRNNRNSSVSGRSATEMSNHLPNNRYRNLKTQLSASNYNYNNYIKTANNNAATVGGSTTTTNKTFMNKKRQLHLREQRSL